MIADDKGHGPKDAASQSGKAKKLSTAEEMALAAAMIDEDESTVESTVESRTVERIGEEVIEDLGGSQFFSSYSKEFLESPLPTLRNSATLRN